MSCRCEDIRCCKAERIRLEACYHKSVSLSNLLGGEREAGDSILAKEKEAFYVSDYLREQLWQRLRGITNEEFERHADLNLSMRNWMEQLQQEIEDLEAEDERYHEDEDDDD